MARKKKIVDALAASEQKYRHLFSAVRDPLFLLDQETGEILDVNEAACLLYGYSRDEILTLRDIDISAEPEKTRQAMIEVPAHIPIRYHKRKDGSVFPLEITASKVIINGRDSIIASMRDITQRIKMEKQLFSERKISKTYLDLASIMFVVLGRTGTINAINKEGCDILGYDEKDIIGQYWFDTFLPTRDAQEVKQIFKKVISGEYDNFRFFENTIVTASGEERIISWHNTTLKDDKGNITGVLSAGSDITDRKKTENALIESERRLVAAQSMAQVGNWELEIGAQSIWGSKQALSIYEYDDNSPYVPLDVVQESVLPEYRKMLDTALSSLIARGKKYDVQFRIRSAKTGIEKVIHSRAELVVDENERPAKIVGTIQDITEQKKLEEKLEYLGYHDQLTGLYNRRFFEKELARLDKVENLPLSFILCDINGLKLVNDSFGHALGDDLLVKSAEVLLDGCRDNDVVCRLGGDEFVIILPQTDAEETVTIANHIKELATNEIIANIELSISYGYDTKHSEEESTHEILANAENYMYRHKLYERSSMRSKAIDIVMHTLFEKSGRESQHSSRVSEICEAIAIKLDFKRNEVTRMKIAGLVHDIGKIGIDEQILNKSGKLTDDERAEMEKHSEVGWRILSSSNEFSELAHYVLNHHERWDGKGYPHGVSGEEIPIEARIITLADAYDAMTSERSYKAGISKQEAKEEILKCAGTHFDPKIVDVFVNNVELSS
ncbi:MAG: PAS domain S-box protein [Clostridia bacterium]|jgi:diguanylate cyclase (GGDEF)-like protein/PAS domain S-box-containing protein|nr:PAS domain S-box protein [Clostridia bacterium]